MQCYTDPVTLAEAIIRRVGPQIVLALPLGLGKANHIANALYDRVSADPALSLTILTALTLEKPRPRNELEGRFLEPVSERLFGDYPALRYAQERRQLPDNIRVEEFFFLAGSQLGAAGVQQDHICANYTHAPEYLLARGVNVVAQLVAEEAGDNGASRYSASCNADLTGEMLAARARGEADFLLVGQVNRELPFMAGDARLPAEAFHALLSGPETEFPLFAPPKQPVGMAEYAAGLHVARLVRDGGTLQIGIGSMADAVVQALIIRHRHNELFRALIRDLVPTEVVPPGDQLEPFREGLHGLSEMLVDTFLDLHDAGILKREVAGKVLSAAFFLGPRNLYRRLRDLDGEARDRFAMRSVSYVNELYGGEDEKRLERPHARFINKGMMATLLGAVISDGLDNGQVVSGVGGQYNFAAQAFALAGARSIITLSATRTSGGKTVSNIRWAYGHCTVPRHLRDIVVTEYGIADLRGKTDAQVIAAMLSVADSRFQGGLLAEAKKAGKIAADYEVPAAFRDNRPDRIADLLASERYCRLLPPFPFGTDFTDTEQQLVPVLQEIAEVAHSPLQLGRLALEGIVSGPAGQQVAEGLARMALDKPRTARDRIYHWLLKGAYRRQHKE